MNDKSAIKALKKGNEKALRYFFDSYYDRLVAYIFTYTNDRMKSEDIVQQSFVNLWTNRDKLGQIKAPRSYLFTMAYNLFIDTTYNEKRNSKLLDKVYEKALRDRIIEDRKLVDERISKLNSVIESLPPKCREILEMNKIQGFKYKEIAETLDISIKTVENQMGIAFKKIRKAFEDSKLILLILRDKAFKKNA